MKTLKTLLAGSILFAHTLTAATYIDLGSLGSVDFSIDAGSVGDYTQTPSQLTFNSFALGDSIYGGYTASNWSAYSSFGIRINLATNPNQPFNFFIYDSTYTGGATGINTYSGISGVLDGNVIPLTLVSSTANLANVAGIGFGLNGDSTTDLVATSVAAVPEPSTYALLTLGALALGAYRMRRRA
jgi:hypothetical protein